jgi:hypothetical protein
MSSALARCPHREIATTLGVGTGTVQRINAEMSA